MANLAPLPKSRFFTAGSATSPVFPLVGGKLYFYEAGTTTPKDTYTSAVGDVPNTNPVILNARGEADVWLGEGGYKMVVTDANDVPQGGPVDGINLPATPIGDTLYEALFAGAVARLMSIKLTNELFSVDDAGAVGSTTTPTADDTIAFLACIATGRSFLVPRRYRTTSPLVLSVVGQYMIGQAGGNTSQILCDSLTGAAVQILQRQSGVRDMTITASNARNSQPYSINTPGVMIGGAGAGSLTGNEVTNVTVTRQPGNAFQGHREGASAVWSKAWSQYNKGHAFFFDDGTSLGLTPQRCGIVTLINPRSNGDGGNAVCLAPAGFTAYRFVMINPEFFDNAWNTAQIAGLINAVIYVRAQNCSFRDGATADQNYAATVLGNGDARTAKASAARGIEVASFSTNITWENMRQINTSQTMRTGTSVEGVTVRQTYANAAQAVGFQIGATNTGLDIDITDPALYTSLLVSATDGGRLVAGDSVREIRIGNSVHLKRFERELQALVSDSLNAFARVMQISGEGGVADTLNQITYAGGANMLKDGDKVTVVNLNAYDITVAHSGVGGNIFCRTNANTVLGPSNRSMSFTAINGTVIQD